MASSTITSNLNINATQQVTQSISSSEKQHVVFKNKKDNNVGSKLNVNNDDEDRAFIVKSDGIDDGKTRKSVSSTVDDASWLSFITFTWIFPWMWRAYKRKVNTDPAQTSQWTCSIFDSANVNLKRLEHLWALELKRSSATGFPPSLFCTVMRFIRFRLSLASAVFLLCIVFGFIGPTCLLRALISFTENPVSDDDNYGIRYSYGLYMALALFMVEIVRVLAYGATWAISYRTAIRTRGSVLTLLYKMLINAKSMRGKTSAEVINIFANDGQRIFDAVTFAPLVLIGPFVLVGGLIYLLQVIGPLSLLAVSIFFIFDVIQAFLGVALLRCRNFAIAETEARLSLIGECIRCIKCIKLNGWEILFYDRVCELRNKEKRYLRMSGYIQSLMIAAGAIVPAVATIVMVLAVVLTGSDLKASDAFSAITVFFVMLFGVRMIPYGIRYLFEARQALLKIGTILCYKQYEPEFNSPRNDTEAIQLCNCTFTWDIEDSEKNILCSLDKGANDTMSALKSKSYKHSDGENAEVEILDDEKTKLNTNMVQNKNTSKNEEAFTLRDINLNIQKGELIGICGLVGCGKSGLLEAITGHLIECNGTLCVSGTVAFCPQQPFIMNTTVRDNILFGQQMNSQRYYKALQHAQLTKDLEQFPENENSKVSACKLSGGQRSRISIARAFYSNRDIYLFDDIFSSVDKPVAAKIFANGVKEMLATKTRLLVTCDPEFLSQCDRVVYMEAGAILAVNSHAELMQNCKQYQMFFALPKTTTKTKSNIDSVDDIIIQPQQAIKMDNFEVKEKEQPQECEEDFGLESVGKDVYMEYIRAGGGKLICVFVIGAFMLNVGSNIFSTYWLSKWMREVHDEEWHDNESFITIDDKINVTSSLGDPETGLSYYVTIYVCNMLFLLLSGFIKAIVFVKFTLNASTRLHNHMLKRVLFAVSSFFNQTPTGRILNRFSKDMDEIDVKLPFSAEALLQGVVTCIGFLLVIIWIFPMFFLTCLPLFFLFLFFFVCFRAGIRSLKRVENITRSPLYEHLSSSLSALSTIHAFGETEKFVEQLKSRLDENSGVLFLYHSAMRWQAVWLDLLVVFITFFVSLFVVLLSGNISPSDAGMAIAFAMQMSGIFQFAVRSQTELEAKMTAVERVSYYYKTIKIEPEIIDNDLPKEWPSSGRLEFDNVVLRYQSDTIPALDHISFLVENAQKIGIIGRTGSGKTSLCNALFRLYPLESGTIYFDNKDISTINLHRLRRSMAIISQEATLFAGTLRFNIDPEGISGGDDKIWECINRIGLNESANMFTEKLDTLIASEGQNLSAGQRQLVCMVRALLRDTKIVILDEATANIDIRTDIQLQQAVHKFFADRTLLLITHRIANVADLDYILEMHDGKIKSFSGNNQTEFQKTNDKNEVQQTNIVTTAI